MNQAAKQELFDRAVAGLAAQGFERATSDSGESCAYRSAKGTRCAMGHLVPAEKYDERMEGRSASALLDVPLWGDTEPPLTPADLGVAVDAAYMWELGEFLNSLQRCHDDADTPADVQFNLRVFARARALALPATLA